MKPIRFGAPVVKMQVLTRSSLAYEPAEAMSGTRFPVEHPHALAKLSLTSTESLGVVSNRLSFCHPP